ncbi:MAG TPA: glycosyltransferase [Chthoniobacterales bacterium]|nr:glycosyltransferase [Chthoniobacterales bacterium]
MKRILILTAGYGEGHNSAARGVRDGLARVSSDSLVEMHDLFAEVYGTLNEHIRRAYQTLINRWPRSWGLVYRWLDRKNDFDRDFAKFSRLKTRLAQLLAAFQPDSIVSTFPAYPYLIRQIAGVASRFKSVVIVTDSITVNGIWCRAPGDYFFLPNEQSAVVARQRGVDSEKIRVFGFPVSPKFSDFNRDREEAPHRPPRILYMINAGTGNAPKTVARLLDLNVELTVTVGRDEKVRRAIEAVIGDHKIEIVGWTDQMPRILSESDLLIGKAGGATVQETIAAGCPMIINHVVSGQEEGNLQLIVETNSGAMAQSPAEVSAMAGRAFAHGAKQWSEWSANIRKLSRPRASLDIAEFLLSI